MPAERVERLRRWHERAYREGARSEARSMTFMGLQLVVGPQVFAPETADDSPGDPFHQTVEAEVRPTDRVLDLGTGSGVSGLLAARRGAEVVAVDVNPEAVECARDNALRNGLGARMTFVHGDVFDGVEGAFDLIVFDPPFRWFKPRDLREMATADEGYGALTRFMREAPNRLRPGGRILLNFGTSGDLDYLYELADNTGLKRQATEYGQATRDGTTAHYFVIKLTA